MVGAAVFERYRAAVLADDLNACAEVAQAIRIPVATGENNYTRYEFRELMFARRARSSTVSGRFSRSIAHGNRSASG